MKQRILYSFLLLLTASIWGLAFVVQKVGMEYIGPFTFNGMRMIIGSVVLLPVILVMRKRKSLENKVQTEDVILEEAESKTKAEIETKAAVSMIMDPKRLQILGGVSCGVALFAASSLQQFGLLYTSVGKCSFITALYVIFVPICSVVLGKRIPRIIWLCAFIALAGFYFLCLSGSVSLEFGDFLTLLAALVFTVHVMLIDYFAPKVDTIILSSMQFFVSGVLSIAAMFLFEDWQWSAVLKGLPMILYTGILSCGVAYTLQVVAQAKVPAALATLLLSMESVIGAVAGALILGNIMTKREVFGCILVFGAVILAQLPTKRSDTKEIDEQVRNE